MIALLIAALLAQDPEGDAELPAPDTDESPAPPPAETSQEIADLKNRLDRMQAEIDGLREHQGMFEKTMVRLSGYLDFGFFWVQGNGSGVRKDLNGSLGYHGEVLDTWTLAGDPLSTTINSRGDVADVGDSRAIRFDPVHAGGRPSFLVNALNLGIEASLFEGLSVVGLLDFLPRDRDLSQPGGMSIGDMFDIKLAFARYDLVLDAIAISFFAGKFDSLLGVEYRTQEAPDRITVTPSLLCRYTCGRPVGVKAIASLLDGKLELGLALTNGTHQSDVFTFTNESDFNRFKTVSGRIAVRLPIGGRGLEVNVNGAIGAQDRQPDDDVLQWHYGIAGKLDVWRLTLMSEFVSGKAQGKAHERVACGAAPCLAYRGAYGLVAFHANLYVHPYVRVDWRTARHINGVDYAYVADVVRATLGLRVDVGRYLILKAEYTFNHELSPLTPFPDDVLTTSLVVRY